MANPRKIWLLYARQLYGVFVRQRGVLPELVKQNLDRVSVELGLALDREQTDRLLAVALAFFEEEYVEAYRRASTGEEPDTELSDIQSCVILEETTGYPVTELFKRMAQEIRDNPDRSEEEIVELLIAKFGAYPAQAMLRMNLRDAPIPENHLPDFCLAQAITEIIGRDKRRD